MAKRSQPYVKFMLPLIYDIWRSLAEVHHNSRKSTEMSPPRPGQVQVEQINPDSDASQINLEAIRPRVDLRLMPFLVLAFLLTSFRQNTPYVSSSPLTAANLALRTLIGAHSSTHVGVASAVWKIQQQELSRLE